MSLMIEMYNKKTIMLKIIVGFFVILVFADPVSYAANKPLQVTAAAKEGKDVLKGIKNIEKKQIEQFNRDLAVLQGRYPFDLPREEALAEPTLRLTGIVWDEKSPAAIINGVLVRKGDMIDGKEVKDITRNSVTVKEGDKEYKLELNF